MACWKELKTSILIRGDAFPGLLEMANRVARERDEPVTSLSARLLRDSLTKIVAKKTSRSKEGACGR